METTTNTTDDYDYQHETAAGAAEVAAAGAAGLGAAGLGGQYGTSRNRLWI
jgi:hypothetical protein